MSTPNQPVTQLLADLAGAIVGGRIRVVTLDAGYGKAVADWRHRPAAEDRLRLRQSAARARARAGMSG